MCGIPEKDVKKLMSETEYYLRGVHFLASKLKIYKTLHLWKLVSEVTLKGHGTSAIICRELGWNPDANIGEPLPEKKCDKK